MLDRFRYFIRRALLNMRQWPFLCSASIITMAVALATVATFLLVVINVQQMTTRWSEELQIVAYLDKLPTSAQLATTLKQLRDYPEIDDVKYVTQKQALKQFRARLGDDADLLDGVDENILPASLEIALKAQFRTRQGISQVVERLKAGVDFDDIRYGQDWLERFDSFVSLLQLVSLVLGSFLLFAALFIVSNTIKLTLYARRDELEIMTLVGATMRFIKIPFLLEGAFQGLLGGLLSLVLLALIFKFFLVQVLRSFWLTPAGIELIFLSVNQQLLLVFCGVLIGMLGSLASLRKLVQV